MADTRLAPQRAAERLEPALDELMRTRGVQHAVLCVESTDGAFRWAGARGPAHPDGTPMTAQTPYFIASIDKLFTAVAVMLLVEEGMLTLDAPLGTYLPPELVAGLHRRADRDHSDEITVRHLLGHTSGLADFLEDRPRGGEALVDALVREGDRAWGVLEVVRRVRDELTPHFPPQPAGARRSRIRYANTNYALLYAVVEAVTGRPLHETYESRLFSPLGLRHTWMVGGTPPADVPPPATLWAGTEPLEIPLALASMASIYATAADQARFLRALVQGEIFADPGTFEQMRARPNRFGLPFDRASLRAPSWPIQYGLGIKRFRVPRPLSGFTRMPALYGHSGSTGTWAFHCPERELIFAGAVDQVTAGAVPYRFLPRLLGRLEGD